MMTLVYKLVGFDRDTEALVRGYDIPAEKILRARAIAGIGDKPAIIADWPLSRAQAETIAELIGAELDVNNYDWALEPYTRPHRGEVERASGAREPRRKLARP
jgi:hypothetical protein